MVLMTHCAIAGDDHIESVVNCYAQEDAVPQSEPLTSANGRDIVPLELRGKREGKRRVNEDAHRR